MKNKYSLELAASFLGLTPSALKRLGKKKLVELFNQKYEEHLADIQQHHEADLSKLGEQNARMVEELNKVSRELEKAKREAEMRACALHAAAFCVPAEHEKAFRTFANSRTT